MNKRQSKNDAELLETIVELGNKKNYGIIFSKIYDFDCVARLLDKKTKKTKGYIKMSDQSENMHLFYNKKDTIIEPLINLGEERQAYLITGEAGSGKSALASILLRQYQKAYPNNKVYLISNKPKEIDRNFKENDELYQLNTEEIKDFDILNYKDTLLIVDDCDYGVETKQIFNILNNVSTVGREMQSSFIFISHIDSALQKGSIYKEYKNYITFQDNMVHNRQLFQNMGFTNDDVEKFIKLKSSYYIFCRIYNVLITDSGCINYRSV